MREIQLRAWDSQSKHFVDPGEFCINGLGELAGIGCLEIQQFTGLKDLNGKEIYEGDVCEIGELPTDEYPDGVCDGNTEIFFSRGQFTTTYYGFPVHSFACNAKCYIKIIGNIHDNPELLTATKKSI